MEEKKENGVEDAKLKKEDGKEVKKEDVDKEGPCGLPSKCIVL